jgi:hypothetical protein
MEKKRLSPAPKWLIELICSQKGSSSSPNKDIMQKAYSEGAKEGARNDTLFRLACQYRNNGIDQETASTLCFTANKNCKPPLPDSEVTQLIISAYSYESTSTPDSDTDISDNMLTEPKNANQDIMYGVIGDIIRKIEPHSESDPFAVLIQLLAMVGNCFGRNCYYQVEATKHFPNLFVQIVGDSSKSRKGTAFDHARNILKNVDETWLKENLKSGLASGEAIIWNVRDQVYKKEKNRDTGKIEEVLADEGVSDKRFTVVETEGVSLLKIQKREGNTLGIVIRNAWDRGDLSITSKNNPAKSTNAHVSVIGHITQLELTKEITVVDATNGFANRFLWAYVKRSKELPFGGDILSVDFSIETNHIKDAVEFAKSKRRIQFSSDAKKIWPKLYHFLSEPKPGVFGAIISRAEAQVVRIALIYAILDLSSAIKIQHLKAALAVWNYCESSARFLFGDAIGDPVAEKVLEAVTSSKEGVTKTEIHLKTGKHLSKEKLKTALKFLIKEKHIKVMKLIRNGRPVELFLSASTQEN